MVTRVKESGAEKPNKLIFNLALKKIDIKDPQIWMIGDNLEKDIIGSKLSINAITLHKKHGVILEKDFKHTDLVFEKFSDINNLFKVNLKHGTSK